MTTQVVSAYVSRNSVPHSELGKMIEMVHGALSELRRGPEAAEAEPPQPAVSIRRSITPEYLVCLEDGRKLKMLKRHLRTAFGMSPEEYRAK